MLSMKNMFTSFSEILYVGVFQLVQVMTIPLLCSGDVQILKKKIKTHGFFYPADDLRNNKIS